ncbi:arabinose efflux permease family protein [Sporocytophaga myxococcoides]|uniref:Arabinose efflux permease family protein n=2 Tax=Sporocytophaga myxococcoides TaxID=153721 RepID=A0A098LEB7_9BACT|nr:arabinose efflux permease family protein [Sporocytophaga myxococcoides]
MIAMLAILQFTVILDFMVLSPLGVILLKELNMKTSQFGLVVSGYAISAGIAGIMAAGFADKYDRKKMLMFFYIGFIVGTVFCALATDFLSLLIARIVTGLFGGVLSSIGFAIITDLFKMEVRGRVMGFVQMAFSVSQVLGIPVGLYLANHLNWHAPFWMIAGLGVIIGVILFTYMKPVNEHLKIKSDRNALYLLAKTFSNIPYLKAFASTTLLATGGFMIMPFASAFTTNNLGISQEDLPILYGVTGIFSMIAGPFIGKYSDVLGKFNIFFIGTVLSIVTLLIYCHLGVTPLWLLIVINIFMFFGITARIISSSALMTGIPNPDDRGAFMSINSAVQQISGGIGSGIAGLIVVQTSVGKILHYDILGYVVTVAMIIALVAIYYVNKQVEEKQKNVLKSTGNQQKIAVG